MSIYLTGATGFVSPSEDVDNLVINIIKLYNHTEDERVKFSHNGRTYFEQEFSMERLINKLETIFNF